MGELASLPADVFEGEIVVVVPVLMANGARYVNAIFRQRVRLFGLADAGPLDGRTVTCNVEQHLDLPTGHRVRAWGFTANLGDLVRQGQVEHNVAPVVLREFGPEQIVVNVAAPEVQVDNYIEAPNKRVTLERDRRGNLKGATIEDAA